MTKWIRYENLYGIFERMFLRCTYITCRRMGRDIIASSKKETRSDRVKRLAESH